MSNSLVERYEQLLAQDPSSTVFVELAKALLDAQDTARAIQICEQGISHHPRSVVGRVLWGKALIVLGRPAEAMEQFDKAVVIDRENPHAYNLIAEVLLQKGLYRSALPLLRKAATLQPNDARIQQWLTQTQAALQGGPPIVLDGPTLLATATEEVPRRTAPQYGPSDAPAPEPSAGPSTSEEADPAEKTTLVSAAQLKSLIAAQEEPKAEPAIPVLQEARQEPFPPEPAPAPMGDPGLLLNDLPPPPDGSNPNISDVLVSAPKGAGDGLLADVPTFTERPTAALKLPKVEVSPQAREAIAKEYERELREKLAEQAEQKTFLQRHGLKLAVGSVVGLAVVAAISVFIITRARNHGRDLADSLVSAKKAFVLDTAQGYRSGIEALAQAIAMDASSREDAWARIAYGRALLYAEHGHAAQDRTEAQHALEQPGVEQSAPGMTLAARYYLADAADRDTPKKAVLESNVESPELSELAGRLLLERHDAKNALDRLSKAAQANNVRALLVLGNYYKDSGDFAKAQEFYDTAAKLSPLHTEVVVGDAECRLSLWQDFAAALEDFDKLPKNDEVSDDVARRRDIAHARLLAATGSAPEAVRLLASLPADKGGHPLELALAQGEVDREAGDMASAQKAYEAALKVDSHSDVAKEGLGRVLIARDREHELLSRVIAEEGSKKVLVVRAAAYAKQGDWAHVRSELQKTAVKGKFPVDSVVYLALADASEAKADVAQPALEKLRATLKHGKPELSVALGTLYWHQGKLERARAQFEDAMKDPLDYEGACSLGRLLAGTDAADKALEALQTAVARNGSHGEARHALSRLLLREGRTDDGLHQTEAWISDNPQSAAAQRDYAFALMQKGAWPDADAAGAKAVKLDAQDAEAHRVRSSLLFQRGDGRAAFDALERANKLNPKDPEIFCDIGRAFIRQGNLANAPKAFEAALRESPNVACGKVGSVAAKLPSVPKPALKEVAELTERAPAVWDRAWAAAVAARAELAMGSVKNANKYAELALKLGPNLADAYFASGLIAVRTKDDARGKEMLEKAVALNPTDATYHLAFADVLARSDKDAPRAYSEYGLFLRLTPKSPEQARVKKLLPALKKRLARK